MLAFVFFVVAVAVPVKANGQNDTSARALRLTSLNDLIFADLLLFEVHVLSKPQCASLCLKTNGCSAFTFTTQQSSLCPCRGHAMLMSEMAGVGVTGSQSYVLQSTSAWLDQVCVQNSECPVPNAECFKGKCLCSPGFYYSKADDRCVLGCSLADLGGSFLTYSDHKLYSSYKLYDDYATTVEHCKLLCLADSLCRSIDYRKSTARCRLHGQTPEEKPNGFRQDNLVDYLQRTCL